MDITLLELTFPEAEFNAPFSSDTRSGNPTTDPTSRSGAAEGPSIRGPAIALLVLLGLALLARYLRGTDDAPERAD